MFLRRCARQIPELVPGTDFEKTAAAGAGAAADAPAAKKGKKDGSAVDEQD